MGDTLEFYPRNCFSSKVHSELELHHHHTIAMAAENHKDSSWFEEELDHDLKWSFLLNRSARISH